MTQVTDKQFIKEFNNCKIKAIDIAYEGTKASKGAKAARDALKFIFFNEKEAFLEIKEADKYYYLSAKNGGRELIKLVDEIDMVHILVKFSMQLFVLLQSEFTLNKERFLTLKKAKKQELDGLELVEFVAFSASIDHYETYLIMSSNKGLLIKLFDLLIDYRYKKALKEVLDNNVPMLYEEQYKIIDEVYKEIRNLVN